MKALVQQHQLVHRVCELLPHQRLEKRNVLPQIALLLTTETSHESCLVVLTATEALVLAHRLKRSRTQHGQRDAAPHTSLPPVQVKRCLVSGLNITLYYILLLKLPGLLFF